MSKEEVKTEEHTIEWYQQQNTQHQANTTKANEANAALAQEKATLTAQMETANQQIAQSQQKISDLETQITDAKNAVEYKNIDKELVDPNVAANLETMQKELESTKTALKTVEDKVAEYEKGEALKAEQVRQDSIVESILKPLDDKYGAKFRVDAKKLADKWVQDGKEKQPKDDGQPGGYARCVADAMVLFDKAYTEVSKEAKGKTSETTDKGGGGKTLTTQKKPGAFNDVLGEMRKEAGLSEEGSFSI